MAQRLASRTAFKPWNQYSRRNGAVEWSLSTGPVSTGQGSVFPTQRESVDDSDRAENNDDEGTSSVSGATGRTRRIACDVCRERKVRCDRGHPQCGRCNRLGHHCSYTVFRRMSTLDVPQALFKLHSRLAHAEERLAMTSTVDSPGAWPKISPESIHSTYSDRNAGESAGAAATSVSYAQNGDFELDDTMMQQALDEWNQLEGSDSMDVSKAPAVNSLSLGSSIAPPRFMPHTSCPGYDTAIPQQTMAALHESYFDVIHPLLPMIDRQRFNEALGAPQVKHALNGLSHAVAMVGAALSDRYYDLVLACYGHARRDLEEAEREEPGPTFLGIHALQALLLITWHEFKQKDFARAWMSLGRAVRLGKVLGLHRMDQQDAEHTESGFQIPLPDTENLADMEERRRTFWVMFALDAYASVRTNSQMAIHYNEVSTFMPTATNALKSPNLGPKLNARDVLTFHGTLPPVSPFAGLVIMATMVATCLEHFLASQEDTSNGDKTGYGFWVQHYRIDKVIVARSESLLTHLAQPSGSNDAKTIILSLNLHAVTIYLHEIAINKAVREALPITLTVESRNRCIAAAVQIADVLRHTENLDPLNMQSFKQMNTYVMWSLSSAARVLSQYLKNSDGEANGAFASLQFLYSMMETLQDKTAGWDDLMDEMRLQLNGESL